MLEDLVPHRVVSELRDKWSQRCAEWEMPLYGSAAMHVWGTASIQRIQDLSTLNPVSSGEIIRSKSRP
jgi:hypothetical protein